MTNLTASSNIAELRQARELMGRTFALDLETAMAPASFGGRAFVRLLQVGNEDHLAWWDLQTFSEADWAYLRGWLEDPGLTVIGHNLAFDYRCLLGCGIELRGRLEDTMKGSQLLWNGLANIRHGLGPLVQRMFGVAIDKGHQTDDWMAAELTESQIEYALADVRWTWRAHCELAARLIEQKLIRTYRLECSLIPAVVEMEHTGIPLDQGHMEGLLERMGEELPQLRTAFVEMLDEALEEAGEEPLPRDGDGRINLNPTTKGSVRLGTKVLAGFNLNAPQQVLRRFNQLDIHPVDSKTGKPSLDRKLLRTFADRPVVAGYLAWKRMEKRRQMLASIQEKAAWERGRVFARFDPLSTGTGRFSSSAPNMQNIPRDTEIRNIVTAPEGRELVVVDVKNMEMGVAASEPIANERQVQEALREGVDLHLLTASLMWGLDLEAVSKEQRQQAKGTNFGCLYGSGAGGLKDYFAALGQTVTLQQAVKFRAAWLAAYPAFAAWHRWCDRYLQKHGCVRMVDGRRRWLNGDQARMTVVANNLVQGTSASIVKRAMVLTRAARPVTARLVAQVHDEIILEVAEGQGQEVLELVCTSITQAGREIIGDSVLMQGEGAVARSWGEAK